MFQLGLSTLFFQKLINILQKKPIIVIARRSKYICHGEHVLCKMLLPYFKHFYSCSGLAYKSKQTSQISEVKMKLSIPLSLHIISDFWWCRWLFHFPTNGRQGKKIIIWNPPWCNNPDFPCQ